MAEAKEWSKAEESSYRQKYEKERDDNTRLWKDLLAGQEAAKASALRIAELEQQLDAADARNSKRQEVRDRALERLAEMLPIAEEQARQGKTALLRLIIRALR
jgi:hypothetical protein